ncbi:chondroitin sulfate synthase 1 [Petromyzon marinus]|uniref:chondroitin sulfate synthase 1 n=1 Tax=Petromyzon marinus TaxID=7757 RepID=UPI003F727118
MAVQRRRAWMSAALGLVLGFTAATWLVVPRSVSGNGRRRLGSGCQAHLAVGDAAGSAWRHGSAGGDEGRGGGGRGWGGRLDPLGAPVRAVATPQNFLYVGVMTAHKYLETRGRAAFSTWVRSVPGTVEFFSSWGSRTELPLPLVTLPGVDDAYPPQKKSFLMLKYMHDHHLDRYEWFMRADDDAYVRGERLEQFLRGLNSSEPHYLGQTGLGTAEELGKLALEPGENFCMGGPGMVFSREALRRVGPHVGQCLRELHTSHEDVEIGRCVRRFAGTQCVWSYEMQQLFYENYEHHHKGYIHDLHKSKMRAAITLHPNKQPAYQHRLHSQLLALRISELRQRTLQLHRDAALAAKLAAGEAAAAAAAGGGAASGAGGAAERPRREDRRLGAPPTFMRFTPPSRDQVLEWDFLTGRLQYSAADGAPPRRSLGMAMRLALDDIIMRVMEMINANSHARGRVIDYKELQYGYSRVNPVSGAEYVLDLLLLYKKYAGKKMTVPVRRHAYLQQSFVRAESHEAEEIRDPEALALSIDRSAAANSKGGSLIRGSLSIFSKPLKMFVPFRLFDRGGGNGGGGNGGDGGDGGDGEAAGPRQAEGKVHVLVPLMGRLGIFKRFMDSFEHTCLRSGQNVKLLVLLFDEQPRTGPSPAAAAAAEAASGAAASSAGTSERHRDVLRRYQRRHPRAELEIRRMPGPFSRGVALEEGASLFSNDTLLLFCDVDLVFTADFLHRCRANTVQGASAYFPIVYSEYNPRFARGEPGDEPPAAAEGDPSGHFALSRRGGFWREYGYGITCIYRGDLAAAGGFDTSIRGWGLEDVDLFSRVLHARLAPFRSQEPGVVHVHHPVACDPALPPHQLRMCLGSRASAYADGRQLAELWLRRRPGVARATAGAGEGLRNRTDVS